MGCSNASESVVGMLGLPTTAVSATGLSSADTLHSKLLTVLKLKVFDSI